MSTVAGLNSRFGMNLEGSRTPEQDARSVCAWLHSREQVRMEQRGQRYFGGEV